MTSMTARFPSWIGVFATIVLATGCGSSGGGGEKTLTAVVVGPPSITVARRATLQLTATGTYSDGSKADVTPATTWLSANTAVATVSSTGLLTGVTSGTSTITATSAGISGTQPATVTAPPVTSLKVTPLTADITAGVAPLSLKAEATFADTTTEDVTAVAAWTTSAPGQVDVTGGKATAPAAARVGISATIKARYGGSDGVSTLRVVRGPPLFLDESKDPLSPQQWYLENKGPDQMAFADKGGAADEDLRLSSARALGLTGAKVKVAILDDRIEMNHEDLRAREVVGSWNYSTNGSDPAPTKPDQDHGTAVAGITAMTYGNGLGGMGVAPGVQLNGYAGLAGEPMGPAVYVQALGGPQGEAGRAKSDDVWVFNQSFGYGRPEYMPVDKVVEDQYKKGAMGVPTFRGGKGAIYVKSAGNNFEDLPGESDPNDMKNCVEAKLAGVSCGNASLDGQTAIPYNIVAGALNAQGKRAAYSTAGSAIWISAPGGGGGANRMANLKQYVDWAYDAAMISTDRTGCDWGKARTKVNDVQKELPYSFFDRALRSGTQDTEPLNKDCNYTNEMNGTSAAAPATTGAVALLLDAREDLTWREVKHILAKTARKVDVNIPAKEIELGDNKMYVAELPWTPNAKGHRFHNWYGFGAVDVEAALKEALTFEAGSLGTFKTSQTISAGIPTPIKIPDNNVDGATSTIQVTEKLTIEAVQISVTAVHDSPGDLGIELTSPSGSKSILLNIRNGVLGKGLDMKLLSNRFYEEPSEGTWTLRVVDGLQGTSGTLNDWQIWFYGH